MEKEYLHRKTNSSTTKHSFGSGLLGKGDKVERNCHKGYVGKAKKVQLMDKLTGNSEFTEEDVAFLDHKIKAKLLKRLSG